MREKHFYDFDRFRIDADERVLLRDGEIAPLTQKAFDVLFVLVGRRGQIVTKEELMNEVWPDTFVEEGNLAQNIYTLRKMLGETPAGDDYIKTIPRRGYRFAATVTETWEGEREKEIPTGELRRLVDLKKEKFSDLFGFSNDVGVAEDKPTDHLFEQEIIFEPPARTESVEAGEAPASLDAVPRRGKKAAAIGAGALLVGVLSVAGWLILSGKRPSEPFQRVNINALTNTGNISSAAISPDGKYVVYGVMDSLLRSSLWITQIDASTSRQIIPPAEIQYYTVIFTPDGKYIYYVTQADRTLYRVSVLGGPSTRLLERAERGVSFSPDGSQIVFRRHLPDRRQLGIFVAHADGSGEKEVAAVSYPSGVEYPAWSPDGKWIAYATGHSWGGKNMFVVALRVGEWKLNPVSAEKWRWLGQMEWLADSSGLAMVASNEPSAPRQIWHLSYPGGVARRITNDSASYVSVSLSADGRSLVALQRRRVTNVWLLPGNDLNRPKQITFGSGGYRGQVAWAPNGRLVYESEVGEAGAISMMDVDGGNPKNLLGDQTGRVTAGLGAVTPDGRYIIYYSDLNGGVRHIWRMDIDGGNPIQLTNGTGEDHPTCSPDGRWVVYTSLETKDHNRPTMWKVSIDGGAPAQLSKDFSLRPAVSPDGKSIACIYTEPGRWDGKLAIFPFEGGEPVKVFPQVFKGSYDIAWAPDGSGLVYAESADEAASVLWLQPLAGGSPRQLAKFDNDEIFGFEWSHDGKQLAVVRGLWALNIVVVKDVGVE